MFEIQLQPKKNFIFLYYLKLLNFDLYFNDQINFF